MREADTVPEPSTCGVVLKVSADDVPIRKLNSHCVPSLGGRQRPFPRILLQTMKFAKTINPT